MNDDCFVLYGELEVWPTKWQMAKFLRNAGLHVTLGSYSIRIDDFDCFSIQEYGGDLGVPEFVADADSLSILMHQAGKVSAALANAEIRHRFEICNGSKQLVGYLHYQWPPNPEPSKLP